MIATNFSDARNDFKKYCDMATDDFETVVITRKGNKNVVLISEAEYNNLIENEYIQSNPAFRAMLDQSIDQLHKGQVVVKTMEELEAMADE